MTTNQKCYYTNSISGPYKYSVLYDAKGIVSHILGEINSLSFCGISTSDIDHWRTKHALGDL